MAKGSIPQKTLWFDFSHAVIYSVFWSVQYICAFVHIYVRLYSQSQWGSAISKSIGLLPTELPIEVLIVDPKDPKIFFFF